MSGLSIGAQIAPRGTSGYRLSFSGLNQALLGDRKVGLLAFIIYEVEFVTFRGNSYRRAERQIRTLPLKQRVEIGNIYRRLSAKHIVSSLGGYGERHAASGRRGSGGGVAVAGDGSRRSTWHRDYDCTGIA